MDDTEVIAIVNVTRRGKYKNVESRPGFVSCRSILFILVMMAEMNTNAYVDRLLRRCLWSRDCFCAKL